jgi:hypothetical protein
MGGSAGRNGRICGGSPPAPSEQRILTHSIRHEKQQGVEGKYKWLTPKQAKKIRHSAGIQIDGGNRIVTPCKDIAKNRSQAVGRVFAFHG